MSLIKINPNSINRIAPTLSEKVTLTGSNVYFLFNFTNDDTNESIFFTASDVSPNIFRYNEFYITETGSTFTDYTNGIINMSPEGFWKYKVYQQTSPTNLSLTGVTGGPIEYGKVNLVGNKSTVTNEYSGNTNTFISYNG